MMTTIPDIAFEINGDSINLEQDAGYGEKVFVILHRSQVALLAAEMGIVKAPHDGEAVRAIATLERRMKLLHQRIVHLDDWLHDVSDDKHADLSYERTFSFATRELAEEFCADLHASAVEADKARTESGQANLELEAA